MKSASITILPPPQIVSNIFQILKHQKKSKPVQNHMSVKTLSIMPPYRHPHHAASALSLIGGERA
ncbi:ATP-binding protein [Halalkalibacter krulwichiae]|uniref:ATP-binding protein n=1 Tax=Halalkalibacter krulwichiae TaxID=199441 RepID=UPI0027D44D04|nr:ATP-binding protein [Halalkalibacter krulwichiae]